MGFNGLELGAEGPFSKKTGASYMVNGRNSFLDFIYGLGLMGDLPGLPKYRDLCGKANIPLRNGNLSAIVLTGASEIAQHDDMSDASAGWIPGDEGQDMLMRGSQAFAGVNYTARFSATTRLENRLSYQRFVSKLNIDLLPFGEDQRSTSPPEKTLCSICTTPTAANISIITITDLCRLAVLNCIFEISNIKKIKK